jgi:nucleoside-diphosphate-sugar epimerase
MSEKEAKAEKGEKPEKPEKARPRSLVTGSCGFMGTHMVEMLAAAGHDVIATDLESAYREDDRKTGRFPGVLKAATVRFVPSDLTRPETLGDLAKGVDYVFHIASVFSYSAPWSVLRRVNVEGTKALLDRLLEDSPNLKRIVVWGAGGIYGLPDPADLPLREDDSPPAPCNDYLRSKWFEEHLVMRYGEEKGLPWTILRPTTVYGPRGVYGGGQLLMSAAQMPVAAMPRNFTSRIPFVHVRDVCGAALFLATAKVARNQAYNLNDDSQLTNVEFFKYVAAITGHKFVELPPVPIVQLRPFLATFAGAVQATLLKFKVPSPIEKPTIEFLGRDFVYSNEKLKSAGYKFQYPDARDGIRDTLEWYRKEGWIK